MRSSAGTKRREHRKQGPLIILKDVLKMNCDEDIIKANRKQNTHLWEGLAEGDFRVVVRYSKNARNQHLQHLVVQVSPQMWSRVTIAGHLYIDMQRVRVYDQSPLIQCTRCLAYGHSKKACRETGDACAHCGSQHVKAGCPQ